MTEQLITEIQRKMLPYLNNEQLMHLRDAMAETLEGATITYDSSSIPVAEETDAVEAFITAKRIEGCSEKTLSYYRKTIEALIAGVGKAVQQITTDDLRRYLTNYQVQRRSSKVTIDNIRRILSSFFSWLEDEDFILKSPVRRIHKVKTAKVVKDTYTDEALEMMRDNCTTARDLAMIDLLASSGMRVGELVTLNREDINFNEREYKSSTGAWWLFAALCSSLRGTDSWKFSLPAAMSAWISGIHYLGMQQRCCFPCFAVLPSLEPTVQDVQRRNFVFYNCTSVMLHGFPFAK